MKRIFDKWRKPKKPTEEDLVQGVKNLSNKTRLFGNCETFPCWKIWKYAPTSTIWQKFEQINPKNITADNIWGGYGLVNLYLTPERGYSGESLDRLAELARGDFGILAKKVSTSKTEFKDFFGAVVDVTLPALSYEARNSYNPAWSEKELEVHVLPNEASLRCTRRGGDYGPFYVEYKSANDK